MDGEEWSHGVKQVPLELLSFQLHSHTSNPYLEYIYEALSLVKSVYAYQLLLDLRLTSSITSLVRENLYGRGLTQSTTSPLR